MKTSALILSLVLGTMAFAQGEAKESKHEKKQARMECLKENPKLKGAELKECVHGKLKK